MQGPDEGIEKYGGSKGVSDVADDANVRAGSAMSQRHPIAEPWFRVKLSLQQ